MSQQSSCKKIKLSKPIALWIVAPGLLLLIFTQTIQAQRLVCVPTVDWRVYLASRGAIYLLHSAKKAQQQNSSTQQVWKTSKDSTIAAKSAPVNTKDLWLAGKSAATSEMKSAPVENISAPIDTVPSLLPLVPLPHVENVSAPVDTPILTKQEPARPLTPIELLASARTIFIKSNSLWIKRKSIEDALMKKKEFLALGYAIVKDISEADLKLEVDHTALTLRYPFTVTHMQTQVVVASGTVISLRILNDVPGDTAGSFVKQAKAARAAFANIPRN